MLTEQEYTQLVADCLELLRRIGLGEVADRLKAIIHKPIIDDSAGEGRDSKDISEATERQRTPQEQLQAVIAFLEARLVHSVNAVSRLSQITRHDPSSIKWLGDEEAYGQAFTGESLSCSPHDHTAIQLHLHSLKQVAGMLDELN